MAMGKRDAEEQRDLFLTADALPQSSGHVFYDKLNGVLHERGFEGYLKRVVRALVFEWQGLDFSAARRLLSHVDVGSFDSLKSQRRIA